MELKTDREIDHIDEINCALLARVITAINECDDSEFIDILKGARGSLSFLPGAYSSFTIYDDRCTFGGINNAPCQHLEPGNKCEGTFCPDFKGTQF